MTRLISSLWFRMAITALAGVVGSVVVFAATGKPIHLDLVLYCAGQGAAIGALFFWLNRMLVRRLERRAERIMREREYRRNWG